MNSRSLRARSSISQSLPEGQTLTKEYNFLEIGRANRHVESESIGVDSCS